VIQLLGSDAVENPLHHFLGDQNWIHISGKFRFKVTEYFYSACDLIEGNLREESKGVKTFNIFAGIRQGNLTLSGWPSRFKTYMWRRVVCYGSVEVK